MGLEVWVDAFGFCMDGHVDVKGENTILMMSLVVDYKEEFVRIKTSWENVSCANTVGSVFLVNFKFQF